MPVLSFPVQCAGEQSSPSKVTLDETTYLQVDLPQQREVDKLSLAILDSKQILLEGDQGQQLPDNHAEDDTLKEGTCASPNLIEELPSLSLEGDEQSRSKNVQNNCFIKTNCLVMVDCNLSNGTSDAEASLGKEVDGHYRSEQMHSLPYFQCNGKDNCSERKEESEFVETICRLSGNTPPVKASCTNEINKDRNGDASNSATSILLETKYSYEEGKKHFRTLHEPMNHAFQTDVEHGNLSVQGQNNELFSVTVNSGTATQRIESQLQDCSQEGESGSMGSEYIEDHTVALWVKWRGKWQTGFQCPRVDCPLQTLRAKPTHERKKYIVIFFPRTRTYSWADLLLTRSINEFPEPLASGTHRKWRKLVKDLTTPRRYIMQKLAVAMLNISDQLHTEAVIENARKVTTWKEFAMEASRSRDYSDLGRMLLKFQTMILPSYMSYAWLEHSWKQRCETAHSAESIELLTKELMASVQWSTVDELWNAPVQPDIDPEWKTWKQEALKWFSMSHPVVNSFGTRKRNLGIDHIEPETSNKRLKLEVRRADSCASRMDASDSGHSICQGIIRSAPGCEPLKVEAVSQVAPTLDLVPVEDQWDEIPAIQSSVQASTKRGNTTAMVTGSYQYRQCSAFIAAKGRQCGRWASDGDVYCCVHSSSSLTGKSLQDQRPPDDAPMCEGLTTQGHKCKHRARLGSAFCKKHRLQRSQDSTSISIFSNFSRENLKRKFCEESALEKISSSNASNSEELQLTRESLVPILVEETLDQQTCLMKESELYNALPTPIGPQSPDLLQCIGYYGQSNSEQCLENAKRHSLYCEKHLPKFLKRARSGKSRLVSKDVFVSLLKSCSSRTEKLHLHQACELLYGFMKRSLTRQMSTCKGDIMDWISCEASKDVNVGQYLLKLVSYEREKIMRHWGFGTENEAIPLENNALSTLVIHEESHDSGLTIKCRICTAMFSDDQTLGAHWSEIHKKEARWLFRGYACAVCMNSFTNKKVLKLHIKEKHSEQFLEHSILFRCLSCNSHFVNLKQIIQHILSSHLKELRMAEPGQENQHHLHQFDQSSSKICQNNGVTIKENDSKRFTCRFCGLKFDILPDLGRHHQVAHMTLRGNHYIKHRHYHPRFKKGFGSTYRFNNQKQFPSSNGVSCSRPTLKNEESESMSLGKLLESHCVDVAEILFSEMQKTKPRPSNNEILSVARSVCCKISLHAALEGKYGVLPENLYLRAAKLCSELNIQIGWYQEGFICPKGCKALMNPHSLVSIESITDGILDTPIPAADLENDTKWEMEECHYILDPKDFDWKSTQRSIVLCEDVSFGKEPVPVACVVDENFKDMFNINFDGISHVEENPALMPWQGFTYVTQSLIEASVGLDSQNSQLGCACPPSKCSPEKCDHVYLFDNDYENAEDIHGKSMHGRFPYDDKGRIMLEQGYLVYECNSFCNCDITCHNRVLQKGLQVKLELFRTEMKGWAVRAGEAIARGTFVCEYIGEVLDDVDGNKRERYNDAECSYFYDINAYIDGARGLNDGAVPHIIDATKFGNISRFINHSCSPNLVNYLVLVESMDSQLAHIGFYTSRDVAKGEELAYDYHCKLVTGGGCPCHCGAPNCRGRVY